MDADTGKVPGVVEAGVMRAGRAGAGTAKKTARGTCARKTPVVLSAEEWAEAERAYFSGATGAEVAARFGVARPTVYLRFGGRGKRAQLAAGKLAAAGEAGAAKIERARVAATARELALVIVRALDEASEKVIEASGLREEALRRQDGSQGVRVLYGDEVWEAARRDYEKGSFTAGRIAERYGMVEGTIRTRASQEGWDKRVKQAPRPLLRAPDPKQVETGGKSAWPRIAFGPQVAPEGAWSTWLFQGGRGAGKTRAGAEWLAARAEATPDGLFALVGPTQHDVREVMIDGPSGIRRLPGRETPRYESSRRKLMWKNGAVAYAFSAEEPERLRGPQFEAAWADEFCTWPKPEHTLALLRMGLRLGGDPRLVVTTTPRPVAALRKLRAEASCVVTQAPSSINAANLTPSFLEGLELLYGGTRRASQELEGELLEGDGALWTVAMLKEARGERAPKFERVVVGVDPPAGLEGSACGIVVCGRVGERGYVLEDASCRGMTPSGWAARVAEAAERHGARTIIAEANQGGEMVRSTLQAAGLRGVELVHASRGKRARAEPVALLYERGRVTHCGTFTLLEEEMMALGVGEAEQALDRADALVWALTGLLLGPVRPKPRIGLL